MCVCVCCVLKRDTIRQGCTRLEGTVNMFIELRKVFIAKEI